MRRLGGFFVVVGQLETKGRSDTGMCGGDRGVGVITKGGGAEAGEKK